MTAIQGVLDNIARHLSPVWTAFMVSALLSLIALAGSVAPNNDGMAYVETARVYQTGGWQAAQALFDWNALARTFMAVLMAHVAEVTGLGVQAAGYLLSAAFLAGTCALLVAITRMQFPTAAWAACAVVLALPGLNNYRDYIIREFGAWFFIFLGFWLALRWASRPTWWSGLLAQVALAVAALFRPEALLLLLALPLWQLACWREGSAGRSLLMIAGLPIAGFLLLLVAMLFIDLEGRLGPSPLTHMNVAEKTHAFTSATQNLSAMLPQWSADEAGRILFFGLLAILPLKLLANLGLFVLPAVFAFRHEAHARLRAWAPLSWAFALYTLVLMVFVLERLFLTSRHVTLLSLLAVPWVAVGLQALCARRPQVSLAVAGLVLLLALANVISTSPRKTHLTQAADWLRQHHIAEARQYVGDAEIAYLAGHSFLAAGQKLAGGPLELDALASAFARDELDVALVPAPLAVSDAMHAWAAEQGLKVLRFDDGGKRAVYVFQRP